MDFSFIVPVYNCRDHLTACVDSIRAVGAESYEILLIDDGSFDGSGVRCDELARRYPEVRIFHKTNGGVSSARNRGIAEARGSYILFVDSDDTLKADALADLLKEFPGSGGDMAVFGISFDYYYKGKCYRRDQMLFEYDGALHREELAADFVELFRNNALSPVWNKVFRREILLRYDLKLNESMFLYEDLEFVLRYLAHCDSILNVPKAVYCYRQSEDEGNAGRRLARTGCLSEFLSPIEEALDGLAEVPAEQRDTVLVQLFQTLAREKIAVSAPAQIRGVCDDYARWYVHRKKNAGENEFHRQLMAGDAMALLLQAKKTALRHKIAVWVKAQLLSNGGINHGH